MMSQCENCQKEQTVYWTQLNTVLIEHPSKKGSSVKSKVFRSPKSDYGNFFLSGSLPPLVYNVIHASSQDILTFDRVEQNNICSGIFLVFHLKTHHAPLKKTKNWVFTSLRTKRVLYLIEDWSLLQLKSSLIFLLHVRRHTRSGNIRHDKKVKMWSL